MEIGSATKDGAAASKRWVMKHRSLCAALVLALVAVLPALSQRRGEEDANTRSVQGAVTDAQESPVNGAIVQIKNTRTLQIRSFITRETPLIQFKSI